MNLGCYFPKKRSLNGINYFNNNTKKKSTHLDGNTLRELDPQLLDFVGCLAACRGSHSKK